MQPLKSPVLKYTFMQAKEFPMFWRLEAVPQKLHRICCHMLPRRQIIIRTTQAHRSQDCPALGPIPSQLRRTKLQQRTSLLKPMLTSQFYLIVW